MGRTTSFSRLRAYCTNHSNDDYRPEPSQPKERDGGNHIQATEVPSPLTPTNSLFVARACQDATASTVEVGSSTDKTSGMARWDEEFQRFDKEEGGGTTYHRWQTGLHRGYTKSENCLRNVLLRSIQLVLL